MARLNKILFITAVIALLLFAGFLIGFMKSTRFVVGSKEAHITLLAVREVGDGYEGSMADLYLEVRQGKGRVFIDTFPLTKVDTQISARYARDVACSFLDLDCSYYDFFYTIRSDSGIIGGPSAGAAITALTVSVLDGVKLDPEATVTGTINSGNLIGPVSGVKQKIDAAASEKLTRVMVSRGRTTEKEGNETVDLVEYGASKGVEVIEVSTLNDLMLELTGKEYKHPGGNLTISENYLGTMKGLADRLCERTGMLKEVVENTSHMLPDSSPAIMLSDVYSENERVALNLTEKARIAYSQEFYYSAASYCFGANVNYRYMDMLLRNMSETEVMREISYNTIEIRKFEKDIDGREKNTMTDLQAYIITKQRLSEAKENFADAIDFSNSSGGESLRALSQGVERVESAYAWSEFFGKGSTSYVIDKDILKKACFVRLAEAEEKYSYATIFFPGFLDDTEKGLIRARSDSFNGNYEMCVFRASKAKAEANVIMSAIGVDSDYVDFLVDKKLDVARNSIISQINMGVFPILGYSYYEYALSLKDYEKNSALIYAEYATELSDLELYFKEDDSGMRVVYVDRNMVITLIVGIAAGFALAFILVPRKEKKKKN